MEEAAGFGKASAAARAVYWALPAELRVHGLYGILTGRMRKLMREGRTAQEAQLQLLRELCAEQGAAMQQGAPAGSKPEGFADRLLRQIFNGPGEASGEQEEIGLLLQAMGRRKCKVVAVAEKDGHRQNIFGAARAAG